MTVLTLIESPGAPERFCKVHTDTLLHWTKTGYVCPKGCGWEQAGRRWSWA